ncbi:MAG: HAMP domain-containing sensor histidine kinase [Ilumatobacteraceae bacterium]|nr:HAMP domain-containing histidine kinase [Ilumatobacter sp.]MCB0984125.1 HAMP domain-containing histidine kinase [Ilumatobacter sp.]
MTLRARLALAMAAIATAFAVVGWFVVTTQRRSLADELDRRLENAVPLALNVLENRATPADPLDPADAGQLYVGVLHADGRLDTLVAMSDGNTPAVDPQDAQANARGPRGLTPFNVGGVDGGEFRVVTMPRQVAPGVPASPQAWSVIAVPTADTDAAVQRLMLTAAAGGVAILLVLGVTWLWVVRLGVRPITEMTAAADAIAAGDRDARLPSYPAGTEAAHLSTAFGEMLGARDAAEGRLRQFVADASHELRTPLTSIRGYADLYHQGAFREEGKTDDAMRRVGKEAERMGRIVDDLLLLSKLDQGVALQIGAVDVSQLLADLEADARALQPGREVRRTVATGVTCRGDAQRLHQALLALVHNALSHTPADTPLTLTATAEAAGRVVVEVVDTGPGMPPEVAAHAFERFYRGDPSRSRHSGGSGLGLAIVQSIVEAHGGTITLHTAPGQGCRFRILLPA